MGLTVNDILRVPRILTPITTVGDTDDATSGVPARVFAIFLTAAAAISTLELFDAATAAAGSNPLTLGAAANESAPPFSLGETGVHYDNVSFTLTGAAALGWFLWLPDRTGSQAPDS